MEIQQLKRDNEELQETLRQSMLQTGTRPTAETQQKDDQLKELSSALSSVRIERTDQQAGRK